MAGSQCTEQFVAGAQVVATSYKLLIEPRPKPPYDALIEKGLFGPEQVIELASVVQGEAQPRSRDSGRVLYELTGGSFHDLFIASWGYEWAKSQGLGRPFDLSS
jgi:ornithine cyclodeaminase/alanine dehydrogenase-like protein (mu-crystallin family)